MTNRAPSAGKRCSPPRPREVSACQAVSINTGSINVGIPNLWMVYFMDHPFINGWFGSTPIYGNPHIIVAGCCRVVCSTLQCMGKNTWKCCWDRCGTLETSVLFSMNCSLRLEKASTSGRPTINSAIKWSIHWLMLYAEKHPNSDVESICSHTTQPIYSRSFSGIQMPSWTFYGPPVGSHLGAGHNSNCRASR